MRKEYDFSEGTRGKYAQRIRERGMTVLEHQKDGVTSTWFYPPDTLPTAAKRVHVFPTKSQWLVRTEGASRAYRRVSTESEAVSLGVALANNTKALLIVHPNLQGSLSKQNANRK